MKFKAPEFEMFIVNDAHMDKARTVHLHDRLMTYCVC